VKEQLEQLALQMHRNGLRYCDAVREFQKAFLAAILREQNGNQVQAAKLLRMHRNTLRRQIQDLKLDLETLRVARRRPSLGERVLVGQNRARIMRQETRSSRWPA
jgi:alpha-D-ribose 1-methylphosphonate 5-triphosphate synthase subunit PhnI